MIKLFSSGQLSLSCSFSPSFLHSCSAVPLQNRVDSSSEMKRQRRAKRVRQKTILLQKCCFYTFLYIHHNWEHRLLLFLKHSQCWFPSYCYNISRAGCLLCFFGTHPNVSVAIMYQLTLNYLVGFSQSVLMYSLIR